jgi:hypothetical protein
VYYIFDADTQQSGSNVYLIGICDLEDLIPNSLWIKLVEAECGLSMTEDDLNVIRKQLNPTSSSTKFHKLLSDKIFSEKTSTGHLPAKTRCAEIFCNYITNKSDIPQAIQDIFLKIN